MVPIGLIKTLVFSPVVGCSVGSPFAPMGSPCLVTIGSLVVVVTIVVMLVIIVVMIVIVLAIIKTKLIPSQSF